MNYSYSQILFIILLLGLSGCTEVTQSVSDKQALTSEIAQRLDSFVVSMNRLSEVELEDFYSDDPSFYWIEDGHLRYPSKENLLGAMTGLIQAANSTNLKILQSKTEILDQSTAMLFIEYEQSISMKSGFELDLDGAMTVLLKKEDGRWNFLTGHSSTKKQRQG